MIISHEAGFVTFLNTTHIVFLDFDKIMVGSPLYVTALRNPYDQLRSLFHYFKLARILGTNKLLEIPLLLKRSCITCKDLTWPTLILQIL